MCECTPKDTVRFLDALVANNKLSEAEFRARHHMGDTIHGFRAYCEGIRSFQTNSLNCRLAEWIAERYSKRISAK